MYFGLVVRTESLIFRLSVLPASMFMFEEARGLAVYPKQVGFQHGRRLRGRRRLDYKLNLGARESHVKS